jgi:hypothetical protein
VLGLGALPAASASAPVVKSFSFTGAPQFLHVPDGVTSINVTIIGGSGGSGAGSPGVAAGSGGSGAEVTATLPVSPSDDVEIDAGGGGVNASGGCFGSSGAGGTGVSPFPDNSLSGARGGSSSGCVAGGGGGGGAGSDVITPRNTIIAGGGGGGGGGGGFVGESGGSGGSSGPVLANDNGGNGTGAGAGSGGAAGQEAAAAGGGNATGLSSAGGGGGGGAGENSGLGGGGGGFGAGGGGGGGAGTSSSSSSLSNLPPGANGSVVITYTPSAGLGSAEPLAEPSLRLAVAGPHAVVPGRSVAYRITLSVKRPKHGEADHVKDIKVVTTHNDRKVREWSLSTLPAGRTRTLHLELEVPLAARGRYCITTTATGKHVHDAIARHCAPVKS